MRLPVFVRGPLQIGVVHTVDPAPTLTVLVRAAYARAPAGDLRPAGGAPPPVAVPPERWSPEPGTPPGPPPPTIPEVIVEGTRSRFAWLELEHQGMVVADEQRPVHLFRGQLPTARSEIRWLSASLGDAPLQSDDVLRARRGLIGASPVLAAEGGRLSPDPMDEEEELELTWARCEVWDGADPPDPRLSAEAFSRVGNEIAAGGEARAAVLARHGFDEHTWAAEEYAWAHRLTGAVERRDLPAIEALSAGAQPPSMGAQYTAEQYRAMAAAIGAAPRPAEEIARHGLSVPEWARLRARWEMELARRGGGDAG